MKNDKIDNITSNVITDIIFLVIMAILIIFFVRGCWFYLSWNNGYCDYCGTEVIYKEEVKHKFGKNYVYICPSCGRTKEVIYKRK